MAEKSNDVNSWKLNQRIEVAGLLFGLCRSSIFFLGAFFSGLLRALFFSYYFQLHRLKPTAKKEAILHQKK